MKYSTDMTRKNDLTQTLVLNEAADQLDVADCQTKNEGETKKNRRHG